jgi:hypothetical protein
LEVRTTPLSDSRNDLVEDSEPRAATTPVGISSVIELDVEEFAEQVVMRAMEFDAIESRLIAPDCCGDE